MIDNYNDRPIRPAFRFIMRMIAARIRIKGFIVFDYRRAWTNSTRDMGQWVASGAVKSRETVVEGLENMPQAFLGLFKGDNTGKMVVRL